MTPEETVLLKAYKEAVIGVDKALFFDKRQRTPRLIAAQAAEKAAFDALGYGKISEFNTAYHTAVACIMYMRRINPYLTK